MKLTIILYLTSLGICIYWLFWVIGPAYYHAEALAAVNDMPHATYEMVKVLINLLGFYMVIWAWARPSSK